MGPKKHLRISLSLELVILLLISQTIDSTLGHLSELDNELGCSVEPANRLTDKCRLLEVFSQVEYEKLDAGQTLELARFCACKLANMNWEQAYDESPSTRRVEFMVNQLVNNETYREHYPIQLWSDLELVISGYSVYVSTNDYFAKRRQDASWSPLPAEQMRTDPALRDIRYLCLIISKDRFHLYQYLENLERISPVVFFKLLHVNQMIDSVYQASKACKILVVHRLKDFKLMPDSQNFYAVDGTQLKDNELDTFNMVQVRDIDDTLKDSSLWLMKCHHWQASKFSLAQLQTECPMMMADTTPSDWVRDHPTPSDRAHMALHCGCQLLLHNNTWLELVQDKQIDVMSKALTNYMNAHRPKNLNSETPLFTFYAWFSELMQQFEKSRKLSVKEIIKLKRGDRDPTDPINRLTGDEEGATELLRTGCNRIMFGHTKGADKPTDEVKPIRYLDNLRYVSQDPMFVFHLSLQDANLFKLHALSRMCLPVIS